MCGSLLLLLLQDMLSLKSLEILIKFKKSIGLRISNSRFSMLAERKPLKEGKTNLKN